MEHVPEDYLPQTGPHSFARIALEEMMYEYFVFT